MKMGPIRILTVAFLLLATSGQSPAADWPAWGRDSSRNMVSTERDLPQTISVDTADTSGKTTIKWVAKLGSQSYGNPTVADGRVYVGTNNDPGRVAKRQGDRGIVLCLDEQSGNLLWQLSAPKLLVGAASDFEQVGICSSPTVENDRVYLVTNRCEVICLDARGLANGNDGPFKDEAAYIAGPGEMPVELDPADADILWVYDMRDELGVFPHQMTSSSVLLVDERLYVTTSNGRDWTDAHTPSPNAPALICLDKMTGKLLGEERSGISSRTFKCNWSSPAYGVVNGQAMVFFGGDDGFCYAFDPAPVDGVLRELWRRDCNPPEYRATPDGVPIKHGLPKGPSGILATPVFHENMVYVAIGQDPDAGEGAGAMTCIDAASGSQVWMNKQIGRSISTAAVSDGLVFIADLAGKVYCLDAKTGQQVWKHDAEGNIWGSPLVAEGRVYIGSQNSTLWVLAADRTKKVISDANVGGPVLSTPVVANGVLYLMTANTLYAEKTKP